MKLNIAKLLIGLASLLLSPWVSAVSYTYDALNRLTSVSYDDGGRITYAYDAAGNIGSITNTPPGAGSTTTSSAASTTTTGTATTTTGAATTTTASTTTTTISGTGGSGVTLNLALGWNLAGNSNDTPLVVADAFGNMLDVITVWKWVATGNKWAFFAPTLGGQALTDYAASKGYDVLTNISGGEGFWVNAKIAFTAQLPAGTAIASTSLQTMASGWNLIAIGDNKTPSQFNALVGAATPLTTLWAWDAAQTNWYFYAPSLEAAGGTALTDYITSKGYLDFTANSKTLGPGTGFWVNKP